MASNIGSAATITGNPQNIIIGSLSRIPYGTFAAALAPAAAAGSLWRRSHRAVSRANSGRASGCRRRAPRPRQPALRARALVATSALIASFFPARRRPRPRSSSARSADHAPRSKPERVYAEIDWALLLMFAGLFIVVAGFEKAVLSPQTTQECRPRASADPAVLSLVAAVLSNLVSNVPAVLALKPFIVALPDPQHAWLVAAMASTFAGNLALLGSVANLIVVQRARRPRREIGFWQLSEVGVPVTVSTILVGLWWL